MSTASLAVILCAACGVTLSGAVRADSEWATRSELGYALARGNSDTENGNLRFDIAHLLGSWIYSFGLGGLYGKSNDIGTAQRWDTHFQADLKLSDRTFWFGAARYERDAYSG